MYKTRKFLGFTIAIIMLLTNFPVNPLFQSLTVSADETDPARASMIYLDYGEGEGPKPLAGFDPEVKNYKVELPPLSTYTSFPTFPTVSADSDEGVYEYITQAEGSNNSAIIRLVKANEFANDADLYLVTFFRRPVPDPVFTNEEWWRGNGQTGTDQRTIPQVNQEEPRSIFVPFDTEQLARANPVYSTMENSSNFLSLNGDWDFHLALYSHGDNGPPDISGAAFTPDTNWQKIKVPGAWQVNWEKAGVFGDLPTYVNSSYQWTYYGHPQGDPNAPRNDGTANANRITPVGSYYRTFNVPADWKANKHVTLSFQGAGQGIYVWVNGHSVGYAEDTFTASEFDITPYIVAGENKLAVRCHRWTQGGFLENQDTIETSGLLRDVFVFAEPKARIRDFDIITDLHVPYSENVDADLDVSVILNNRHGAAANNYTVEMALYDENNQSVGTPVSQAVSLAAGEEYNEVNLTQLVVNPKKWSAEKPNLYTAVLTLRDGANNVIESIGRKVGFRKFYMDGAGTEQDPRRMYLNGKIIYLKGVNRGEASPQGGKSVPRADMEHEVMLMKRNNINSIRVAHYPSDLYLYELADKYGLYIMDEFNIESHNGRNQSIPDQRANAVLEVPVWRNSMLQRAKNAVMRVRNNPSVIMWSLGNESGFGPNHRRNADLATLIDPTRLIHSQGAGSDNFDPRLLPTGLLLEGGSRGAGTTYAGGISTALTYSGSNPDPRKNHAYDLRLLPAYDDWAGEWADKGNDKMIYNASPTEISSIFYPKVVNEIRNYNVHTTYVGGTLNGRDLTGTPRFPFANQVPRVFTEISHAMGNALGCFFVYADAIEANPRTQGMWIWEWKDNSIWTEAEDGTGFYGYGGDWTRPGSGALGDGNFCADGVVLPDGTPSPGFAEIKASYQDIKMTVEDDAALLAGDITFRNNALFTDPSEAYDVVYTLTSDVKPDAVTGGGAGLEFLADQSEMYIVDSGVLDLSDGKLPPIVTGNALSTPDEIKKVINVPYRLPADRKPGAEYYLNIYFVVKDGTTNWAEEGHVASAEQFKIPVSAPASSFTLSEIPDIMSFNTGDGDFLYNITGKTEDDKIFTVVINQSTGLISKYEVDGKILIENGPVPNFVRAFIDNDNGGQNFGNRSLGIARGWQYAGRDRTVESVIPEVGDKSVTVTVSGQLASFATNGTTSQPSDYSIEYKILGNGDIMVINKVNPNRQAHQYMSLVGGYLQLPDDYENVTYYGSGPEENYIDRRTGTYVDLFETTVDDMYVNRMRPQEYGNRTDVRWVAMTDDDGYGLMAISDSVMEFSPKRWETEEMQTFKRSTGVNYARTGVTHPHLLPEPTNIYLNLNHKQMGVAGEDWGSGTYGPGYSNTQGTGTGGHNNGAPNGTAIGAAAYPLTNPPEYNFYVENTQDYEYSYTLRPVFPAAAGESQALAMMESSKEVLDMPSWGIGLDKTGTQDLDATYGYEEQAGLNVDVLNTGINSTGSLEITLSGENQDSFVLSKNSIESIAAGRKDSFTVTPNTGLAAGTYIATVTVSGANDIAASFNIRFTVNPVAITDAAILVTAPATGESPVTIASGTGNFTIGPVSWTPGNNPFRGSTQYTAAVTLTANANYTFTGLTDATINGQTAIIDSNSGNTATLSYKFTATNPKAVTKIAIKNQPSKLVYTNGNALNLSGLVVTLTYNDSTTEDVTFANFAAKNISAVPAHGVTLSRTAHNNRPVVVSYNGLKVNTANLTVNTSTINPPKAGTKFTVGNFKYKIMKSATAKGAGTVQVMAPKKKTLTKVTIPATVKHNSFTYKVVSIAKNAFKSNTKLKKVIVGSNVKQILNNAFTGCKKLTNVTIGKNVTKIGKKAFYNNKKLQTINIKSKKLKWASVGKSAFKKIHRKAKIKAPTAKLRKSYQKFLKK